MKHILCALMEPNEYLLKHLYEFGRKNGWQIERCGREVPEQWSGDGIISDYLEPEDFRRIRNFAAIPTVSRLLPPRNNIRTVRPDTSLIASMIVDYFADKGFTRFVSIAPKIYHEDIDGKPRDILEALRREVEKRNFSFELCIWNPPDDPEANHYERKMRVLRSFFRRQPKPFALVLSMSPALSVAYRVLFDLKIRIPEEAAVLNNTDDWSATENAIIPTSYIGGEYQELAYRLAELLKRMMNGEHLPETPVYVTPSSIVERRSTDTLAVSDIRLAKAVSFYLQNYMNLVGVEDAARVAGISRVFLARLFQQQFGKTPRRVLQEIRYNQIRHLLDTTDLSLTEIANRTGYGSAMALSLAFKREYGVLPGLYRTSRR